MLNFLGNLIKETFLNSSSILLSTPSIVGSITLIAWCFPSIRRWWDCHKMRIRRFIPHIAVLLIIFSIVAGAYNLYQHKEPNFTTPDALIPLNLRDLKINVADLVRQDAIVKNKTFYNCDLYGPAVFGAIGEHNVYDVITMDINNPSEGFIVVETPITVTGVIGIDSCQFINCRLHGVAFMGNEEDYQQYLAAIK